MLCIRHSPFQKIVVVFAYICITALDVYSYPRKKVLLVYSRDSDQHHEVVHRFVHFLERHCNVVVDVDYNSRELITGDRAGYIMSSIQKADKILLVISDGVRQYWTAATSSEQTTDDTDDDPDGRLADRSNSAVLFVASGEKQ